MNQKFKISRSRRWRESLYGGYFLSAAVIYVFIMPFPNYLEGITSWAFYLVFPVSITIFSVPLFRLWVKINHSVQTDIGGISSFSCTTANPVYLSWRNIDKIEERISNFYQYLILSDTSTGTNIYLDCSLDKFEQLLKVVQDSVKYLDNTSVRQKIFQRNSYIFIVYFINILIAIFLCWGIGMNWISWTVVFGGIFLLFYALLKEEVCAVYSCSDNIIIKYIFKQRKMQYNDMLNIHMKMGRHPITPFLFNLDPERIVPLVCLELKDGKSIRLASFKEGTIVLYDSLARAWEGREIAPNSGKESRGGGAGRGPDLSS